MSNESGFVAVSPAGRSVRIYALAAMATLLAACGKPATDTGRLAPLPIDPASVTVSGLSAGASMATQFHVAHSKLVNGAALIAGAPYYCSAGSIRHSLGRCMKADERIPTSGLVELTSQMALEGAIDPIADLANDRVWIFHGGVDPYVRKPVADAVIVRTRVDMAPDGMADMVSPVAQLPATEPGVYSFKTDLPMAGRYLVSIAAKVQGEVETVVGKVIVKAVK